MDKKLVFIGGGGHCKSVLDAALRSKEYSEIVITDPTIDKGTELYGCKFVGGDNNLSFLKEQGFQYAFITVGSIGDSTIRKKLADNARALEFQFPVISDPSAAVSDFAKIGEGTFIGKNAVVNTDAVVGNHCIVNTGSIIEHECMIGDFSHIALERTFAAVYM